MAVDPSIRDAVLRELEVLASLELQSRYERDVPVADVPAELVCGWFDDLDLPASASKVFTGTDLESVQRFSDSFETALKDLEGLSLSELHANPPWLKVVESAGILLRQLRGTR